MTAADNPVLITFQGGGRETVERAASLLALAKKQEEALAPLLVACAAVVLASALDRATAAALDFLLQCAPGGKLGLDEEDIDADFVRRGQSEGLRGRVGRLPEVLTNGRLAIHHASTHGKAIAQLVYYRNRFAHPTDPVKVTELSEFWTDTDGTVHATDPAMAMERDKWEELTLADGDRFLRSVGVYFDEVIDKVTVRESLRAGALLSTSIRH